MTVRVLLTAADGAFRGLDDALAGEDVRLETQPLLRFADPESWQPVDEALRSLATFGALAVTSPRGAAALGARAALLRAEGVVAGAPWHVPKIAVWTTGAATAAALGGLFPAAHRPADGAVRVLGAGAALAEAMLRSGVHGPVLYACGDRRRDELPQRLESAGIAVHEVVCYRTVLADPAEARARAADADVLVVASPSVAQLLGRCGVEPRPPLVAVGPTTAAAASQAGWPPALVADAPTVPALARALRAFLSSS